MQVRTERGIINVLGTKEALFLDRKTAVEHGYGYSFTANHVELPDKIIKADVYGKCLDDRGLRHEFVLVKENNL